MTDKLRFPDRSYERCASDPDRRAARARLDLPDQAAEAAPGASVGDAREHRGRRRDPHRGRVLRLRAARAHADSARRAGDSESAINHDRVICRDRENCHSRLRFSQR